MLSVLTALGARQCFPDPACTPRGCGDRHSYCHAGTCFCEEGYASCDGEWANGCEVDLDRDPGNCGGCDQSCGQHAVCRHGSCACATGSFADCNDHWRDGCESNLDTDDRNCGACGEGCPPRSHCSDGECRCEEGTADCDWLRTRYTTAGNADGCECLLTRGWVCDLRFDEPTCCIPNPGAACARDQDCCGEGSRCQDGFCYTACEPEDCGAQGSACVLGICRCLSGFGNCDRKWDDGCETDLRTDVEHCGACGHDCGAHAACVQGRCTCLDRHANCNGLLEDGCETDLRYDDDGCGGCGIVCPPRSHCVQGECRCVEGFADCDRRTPAVTRAGDSDGCECPLGDGWTCDALPAPRCCMPNPGAPCELPEDCCGPSLQCRDGVCRGVELVY